MPRDHRVNTCARPDPPELSAEKVETRLRAKNPSQQVRASVDDRRTPRVAGVGPDPVVNPAADIEDGLATSLQGSADTACLRHSPAVRPWCPVSGRNLRPSVDSKTRAPGIVRPSPMWKSLVSERVQADSQMRTAPAPSVTHEVQRLLVTTGGARYRDMIRPTNQSRLVRSLPIVVEAGVATSYGIRSAILLGYRALKRTSPNGTADKHKAGPGGGLLKQVHRRGVDFRYVHALDRS